MNLFGVFIENVRRRLSLVIVVIVWLYYGTVVGTFSGRIINRDLRLHVVHEYVEADAVSIILYRVCFHLHAMSKQIVALIQRRYTVHNVVAGFFNVVGYHIFKGKHTLNIKITGARYKILFVCVFTRKLEAYKVASVVYVPSKKKEGGAKMATLGDKVYGQWRFILAPLRTGMGLL